MKTIQKALRWLATSIYLMFIRLGISMHNAEHDILKANPNLSDDKDKKNQKLQTTNPLFKKMENGERDDQFVSDYYEVLKKGDKFLRNATPHQIEVASNKHGLSLGKTDGEIRNIGKKNPKKDRWGRRYDHFGFFDPKSKHYGKTMAEVMIEEINQRSTKDDKYPIEFMYSNKINNVGLVNNDFIVEDNKLGFREVNVLEKAKATKYPMTVMRENDECFNKIEQLTEYVHIKKLDDTEKIIEFFIPEYFKVFDHDEDSDIFKEIINIKSIWVKDEYGVRFGYSIDGYHKRSEIVDESIISCENNIIYHVIKLRGRIIENIA